MRRRREKIGGRGRGMGDALLTVSAIGGLICIALVILALFFQITLIMFKTGSMSPTIPAGSLAVVRQIPATEVKVGDVVTIDRPQSLPVTHRVVSIEPAAGNKASIIMRGDANPSDDPQPYVVENVREVLFSVPRLANFVVVISNPLALGTITVCTAALVTWAFWPGKDAPPPGENRTARHLAGGGTLALMLILVGGQLFLTPVPAHADTTEHVVRGPVLTLTSVMDLDSMNSMAPGTATPWQIGVSSSANTAGSIRISLASEGPLASGASCLELAVRMCNVRWVAGSCTGGGAVLRSPAPASSITGELTSIPVNEQRWILIVASLPDNSATPPSGTATLTLTASGAGDDVSTGGSLGSLPRTGTDLLWPSLAAMGAVTTGIVLASLGKWGQARKQRREEDTL